MESILLTLLSSENNTTNVTDMNRLFGDRIVTESVASDSDIATDDLATAMADAADEDALRYQRVNETVQAIIRITTPLIIGIGCVGNLLALAVLRMTTQSKHSSSYYLAALCISDTCFLVLTALEYVNSQQLANVFHRPVACELLNYLSGVFSFLSVWFVVAFTAERYVAVGHPLRRPKLCTVSRTKMMLVTCTAAGMALNTPLLYFSDLVPNGPSNRTICELSEHKKEQMESYNKIDMWCVFIIPACLIIVLNTFMVTRLWIHNGFPTRQKNTTYPQQWSRNSTHYGRSTYGQSLNRSKKSSTSSDTKKLTVSQNKITIMLLFVSSTFVVLNFPSYAFRWYTFDGNFAATPRLLVIQYITVTLFQISFAMNFFLYCMSGQNFRKSTWELLARKSSREMWRRQGEPETQATVPDCFRRSWQSIRRRPTASSSTSMPSTVGNTTTITLTRMLTTTTTTVLNNETGATTTTTSSAQCQILDV